MNDPILEIRSLCKSYGETPALDNFSLDVRPGEVLGLLGPNGAGKTTLISVLSGTLGGFSGTVRFKGTDLFSDHRLKNQLGIVPQEMAFYEELNARDNLFFWGGLYDLPRTRLKERIEYLLEMVELSGRSREPVKRFSGGMKRRLNLAIGLIHEPELLLLDEPTVGIDVQAKVSVLDMIRRAGSNGTAVIFTTHQLSEVENTCTRIAIMDRGAIHAQGSLTELIRIVGEKELVDVAGEFKADGFTRALNSAPDLASDGIELLSVADNMAHLSFESTEKIPLLLETLFNNRIEVTDLKIKSPSLESVFLKLTGRSLRD